MSLERKQRENLRIDKIVLSSLQLQIFFRQDTMRNTLDYLLGSGSFCILAHQSSNGND